MKTTVLALLAILGLTIGTVIASHSRQDPSYAPPADLPAAALEILEARPFVVDQPFVHEWRAEKPLGDAGYLLVLKVRPDLGLPRETYEPVLYAGEQTAERCNRPPLGTHMVVLVPAAANARGEVQLDLERTPIWFGSLELPERVDAARIAAELAAARSAGIRPAPRAEHARRASAADTIHVATRADLDPYLADWIERYSPEETDLVRQLRR